MAPNIFSKRHSSTQKTFDGAKLERKETPKALGLRECHKPANVDQAIDIVFVHGLTGDREQTWTHRATTCFWPETLLPSDVPDARVFTYGYDADVAHFFSQASRSRIGDHAKTLLNDLARIRERTESNDRPLIFVAHSLGGLVVEDMLLSSKNSAEPHHRQMLELTEGIVFMGTPHCGSQLADWAKIGTSMAKLVRRLNEDIISVLQPGSEVLARIQQEFHTMLRARNDAGKQKIRIVCFYEDLDTPGVGSVIPKHSAILPAYVSISIPSDHSGMTKFTDAKDPGYERVSGELWMWAREIRKKRPQARPEMQPNPMPSTSEPPMLLPEGNDSKGNVRNYFMGSMSNVGQVMQGTNNATLNLGAL